MSPKFKDAHRFSLPYVPASAQGEGYLQKRFEEIRAKQKEEAAKRLTNVIAHRKGMK